MYILLSGGLFLQIKVFPEGSGHEGLLELVIDEEISDVGFVQEHDFEVFCAVKVVSMMWVLAYCSDWNCTGMNLPDC